MKRTSIIAMLALALAGCGPDQPAGKNNAAAIEANTATGEPDPTCVPPRLDLTALNLDAERTQRFTADFRSAFDEACGEGLMAKRPLVDPRAADRSALFVKDAPDSNVVSIYFDSTARPPRMILEGPFGAVGTPSIQDIHEALYCALNGPTREDVEVGGRCLVD